jgi:hypothetical protein
MSKSIDDKELGVYSMEQHATRGSRSAPFLLLSLFCHYRCETSFRLGPAVRLSSRHAVLLFPLYFRPAARKINPIRKRNRHMNAVAKIMSGWLCAGLLMMGGVGVSPARSQLEVLHENQAPGRTMAQQATKERQIWITADHSRH